MRIKTRYILSIFLAVICFTTTFAQGDKEDRIPSSIGRINDFEKVFSIKEVKVLDSIVNDFKSRTEIQFAIITIDSTMTTSDYFEGYVGEVGNTWNVGGIERNGIVIGFSKNYKKIRIANGRGIEKLISDKETSEIIEKNFIPYFKKGEYYKGFIDGLTALINLLKTKIKE
jgi:uncharacterized protein